MITKDEKLHVGTILQDSTIERFIILERRTNPQGATPPFWTVRNTHTKRMSVIRENRLYGKRWSISVREV